MLSTRGRGVESGTPDRQIRALFTERTITVYQAYSPAIAEPAVAVRLVPEELPFALPAAIAEKLDCNDR